MTRDTLSSRRSRALSEEDRALWHAVAKSTKPLKRKKREASKITDTVDPGDPVVATPASAPLLREARQKAVKSSEKLSPPPLAPLGRKERLRLSRGRHEIDARIDLHGMTQMRAHRALLSFLQGAYADGATFVLVITGKGRTSASEAERGVLRRQVPLWLDLPEFRALVVGFEQAHLAHGGEGALYVRMRRAR